MKDMTDQTLPSRIGVEIGGTFTDMVWARTDGVLQIGKTPSTPEAIQAAVLQVIAESGADLAGVAQVTHGSTVATNALITRRGASAGLLTTRGFRDTVIVGRGERDHNVYNMRYHHPKPPIRRGMIREVDERIGPDGDVLTPLNLDGAWAQVEAFIAQGVEGIAICLMHAYANPEHEKALAAMIRARAPGIAVSASHEVSPEFREYERSVTTVVNAFVGPVVETYIKRLDAGLRESGYGGVLRVMQSNGGVMPATAAGNNAVRMLLSGPAAGVRGAMWFAERNGISDAITLDMGGTSTDIAVAPGRVPGMVPELKIDGLPVRTASVDMATIGAGGGSIAGVDPGGFMAVGPQSAGARPGPACYGHGGTDATVTDAQVVAGLLRPSRFFGGRMALDEAAARRAIDAIPLPGTTEEKADSIIRIVNSNMAAAVRLVSTGRGIDPRGFTLIAFGGGGPLHTAMVAEELDIRQVLVPWAPGLASAFGLLIADTIIDAARSALQPLSDDTLDGVRIAALRDEAVEVARLNGLAAGDNALSIGVDMRYLGQAFELTVWTDGTPADAATLRRLFEDEHRGRYGYSRASLGVEVVAYRLRLSQPGGTGIATPAPVPTGLAREKVEIQLGGVRQSATFLSREDLGAGEKLAGPAILAEATSTTIVPAGWEVECLPTGDLMLRNLKP